MQASIQNTSCIITERARNRLTLSTTESTEVLHSDALDTLLFCLSGSWRAGSHRQAVLWPSLRCGRLACPLPCTAKPPQGRAGFCHVPVPAPISGLRQLRSTLWVSCSYQGCLSFELAARKSTASEWERDSQRPWWFVLLCYLSPGQILIFQVEVQ